MAEKRKRKYTFRKGKLVSYESGSLMHLVAKIDPFKNTKKKKRR